MELNFIKMYGDNNFSSIGYGPKDFQSHQLTPSFAKGFIEPTFNPYEQQAWFRDNWTLCLYFIAAYVIFIYLGQEFMRNRKPFELKRLSAWWNFCLAVFSIRGCITVLPEFHRVYSYENGFFESVCRNLDDVSSPAMFWGWLFALSKIVELGDTVFLILRKRNLIFLHWYHHITVLLYVWYSYADHISPARWFICVNYSIHALMYSYYWLRSIEVKVPRWIAMTITTLQLSQMVVGVTVNVYASRMKSKGIECAVSPYHLNLGFIMYASYFFLFAHFFHKAYLRKDTKTIQINNKKAD